MFIEWVQNGLIPLQPLPYHHIAEYLVHLFDPRRGVKTIKVHRSSITSAHKIVSPPTPQQDEMIFNMIRAMFIQQIHNPLPKLGV